MSGSSGTVSGMDLVVTAEAAHARKKRMRAINFGYLPYMAEIVKRKFVEQFPNADLAQILMLARAPGGFGRQSLQHAERDSAFAFESRKLGEGVKARAISKQSELIVRGQKRFVAFQHCLKSAAETRAFHVVQMCQHHRDRPAIRRRLPGQIFLARGGKQAPQNVRRLSQNV